MKKTIQVLLIALILCALSVTIFAQKPTRVKFRKGATSATISGTLSNYKSTRTYVIRVRAGQTLKVEQIRSETSAHYVTLSIKNPAGEDVTDADASCNSQKEVTPTEAGDYVITVVECMKADVWRGNFKLKFTVE